MGPSLVTRGALAALLAFAGVAGGDVIVLTDGERITGDITPATDADGNRGFRVVAEDGAEEWIANDRVERFILGSGDGEGAASARLESLRRSVANAPSLDAIVLKYEAFLRQTEDGSPEAAEAEQELAAWRQRRDDGYVQLGREWVAPAERDRLLASAFGQINEARLLVGAGDLAEAGRLATELSRGPAGAAGGEYLLGVIAVARDDIAAARRHFRAAQELVPDHAPTLVNLAALQANFGQPERALWFLAQALKAAPGNEQVIANTIEALRLLPADERDGRNARAATALYERQEADLARSKSEQGLTRWGNTWIGEDERAAIEAQRQEVEARVAELKEEYDNLALNARRLEDDIQRNIATMRQMEAASYRVNAEGEPIRVPLPQIYYQMDQDVRRMQAQLARASTLMAGLDEQAARERQALPQPPFDGRLSFIGENGVPVTLPPAAPATAPDGGNP